MPGISQDDADTIAKALCAYKSLHSPHWRYIALAYTKAYDKQREILKDLQQQEGRCNCENYLSICPFCMATEALAITPESIAEALNDA